MARGTSTLKRTPLARTSPLKASSMTLAELREARGAKGFTNKGSGLRRRTKLREHNPEHLARKMKAYRARLAAPDWEVLRQAAYQRDGGLCQCPVCVTGRKNGEAFAFEPIPIWFKKNSKRIFGFSTHHTTYARFGHELLEDILTMVPSHHEALEAAKGYRKRWLAAA